MQCSHSMYKIHNNKMASMLLLTMKQKEKKITPNLLKKNLLSKSKLYLFPNICVE